MTLLLVLLVFRSFFFYQGTLSASDWPYLFNEHIQQFSWLPEQKFLWLAPYYQIVSKFFVVYFNLPWPVIERIFWFWPWVFLSYFSAKKFTQSSLGGLIYSTNTYALMIVGGGQMGVAMAYALAPMVLMNPWVLPIQVMFDPRIALLTFIIALRKNWKHLIVPVVVTIMLHTYWWIPFVKNPSILSQQFQEATSGAVKYLSVASFSNTMSLLHPNWPENIFGKVYFQRPEFLVIPIVAFSSLLFQSTRYYALVALLGVFLAKGANEPFGGLYVWLFDHVPGFSLFRDPTKFYLYIALGFSVMVSQIKRPIFVFAFILFWAFTIREGVMGNLTGTFQPVRVSEEYTMLQDSSVAWYPKKSRFSFSGSDFVTLENVQYVAVPTDVRGEIFVTDRVYDDRKRQEAIKFVATMSGVRRLEEYKELAVFEVL